MGLRAGLDWCGKSRPTGIRSPDPPARRQSLYRLSYPAHKLKYFSDQKLDEQCPLISVLLEPILVGKNVPFYILSLEAAVQ